MRIHGRCGCGSCSYVVSDDAGIDVANCHCAMCRKTTGGTFVTWATVPRANFRWTGRRPRIYRSSAGGRRYFCGACGAQLALTIDAAPDTIDVTVSTFSAPDRYPPNRHIWVRKRIQWVLLGRKLGRESREILSKKSVRRSRGPRGSRS